jgi:hypothetical protein
MQSKRTEQIPASYHPMDIYSLAEREGVAVGNEIFKPI